MSSELLTKACYHSTIAKQYLDGYKIETNVSLRDRVNGWINRLEWFQNDVYASLTDSSRKLYQEELQKGDVLFYPNISEMLLRMNEDQRNLVERICEGILKGELIEFKDV